MKPNQNSNRPRRPRRSSGGNRRHNNQNNNPNKHSESLGPNVRIRGSANQIYEKYMALASDAKRNDDRVLVENLTQHAEHYLRIMNHFQSLRQERQNARQAEEAQQDEAEVDAENETDTAAESEEDTTTEENGGAIVEDLTPKVEAPAPLADDDED